MIRRLAWWRDEGVNIRTFKAIAFEELQAGFGLLAHGEP